MTVGEILNGRVTGITAFGAFVTLENGKSGLIHISEVASSYVRDVHDYLSEQQEVRVKVIGISPEGKISLSLRQAAPPEDTGKAGASGTHRGSRGASRPNPGRARARNGEEYVPETSGDWVFEDKLKRFMQESDGKMSGSRLYQQQRKGQRRRK